MGTVYRTNCGCLKSSPEPTPAEFQHEHEYEASHQAWANAWQEEAREHVEACPLSLHFRPPVHVAGLFFDSIGHYDIYRFSTGFLVEQRGHHLTEEAELWQALDWVRDDVLGRHKTEQVASYLDAY